MSSVVARMREKGLTLGFNGWMALIDARNGSLKAVDKGVGRFRHKHLSPAFVSWLDTINHQKEERGFVKRAVGCWKTDLLTRGWLHWVGQADMLRHKADERNKQRSNAISHLLNRRLSLGWGNWLFYAAEERRAFKSLNSSTASRVVYSHGSMRGRNALRRSPR